MLIADVSSSVAAFAGFTLQLANAISAEFSRVRSFAFTDGIEEITDDLSSATDIATAVRRISSRPGVVRLDGHSDYGMVLESFWERWGPQIRAKTSVIILGDGRSNYHASRSGCSGPSGSAHVTCTGSIPSQRTPGIPVTPSSRNTESSAMRWWNAGISGS